MIMFTSVMRTATGNWRFEGSPVEPDKSQYKVNYGWQLRSCRWAWMARASHLHRARRYRVDLQIPAGSAVAPMIDSSRRVLFIYAADRKVRRHDCCDRSIK